MSKFQIGDRVVLARNPDDGHHVKLPLGDIGTVTGVVKGISGAYYLKVEYDQPCRLDSWRQKDALIETRFDFAEDHELTEVSSDVGTLLFG